MAKKLGNYDAKRTLEPVELRNGSVLRVVPLDKDGQRRLFEALAGGDAVETKVLLKLICPDITGADVMCLTAHENDLWELLRYAGGVEPLRIPNVSSTDPTRRSKHWT